MTDKSFLKSNAMPNFWLGSDELRNFSRQQTATFWKAQSKLLDNFESLTTAWVARRRAAAEAALDAAERICECDDMAKVGEIYNEWLSASVERMNAEAKALAESSVSALKEIAGTVEATGQAAAEVSPFKSPAPQREPRRAAG